MQILIFESKYSGMLIIGIAGGTGCGKTTVVNQIINELPNEEVGVISQDSYYNDLSHLTLTERKKQTSTTQNLSILGYWRNI